MSRRSRRREIKMFLAIIFICFVIAALFSFVTGELPSLVDRIIYHRVTKQIEKAKKEAMEKGGIFEEDKYNR